MGRLGNTYNVAATAIYFFYWRQICLCKFLQVPTIQEPLSYLQNVLHDFRHPVAVLDIPGLIISYHAMVQLNLTCELDKGLY